MASLEMVLRDGIEEAIVFEVSVADEVEDRAAPKAETAALCTAAPRACIQCSASRTAISSTTRRALE
jgi:hypothetical protein